MRYISACARLLNWCEHATWTNIPLLKLRNIPAIFPNFQKCACCKKYFKDHKQAWRLRVVARLLKQESTSPIFGNFFFSNPTSWLLTSSKDALNKLMVNKRGDRGSSEEELATPKRANKAEIEAQEKKTRQQKHSWECLKSLASVTSEKC